MPPTILDSAINLHRAGRLDQAEGLYRQVRASDPNYADALHLLGVIHAQRNQHAQAGVLIRQAIALRPDFAEFHRNLGLSLLRTRQIGPAIECYRTATRLE